MKRRRNIFITIAVILLVLIVIPVVLHYRAKGRLEAYKKQLIAQGEKLTIAELKPQNGAGENGAKDFSAAGSRLYHLRDLWPVGMKEILPGKAEVAWRQPEIVQEIRYLKATNNIWPILSDEIATNSEELTEMQHALTQPQFYFSCNYDAGIEMLLPHLAPMKQGMGELAAVTEYYLHAGNKEEAAKYLTSLTREIQVYRGEPMTISQRVRVASENIAFSTLWETLQTDDWTDEQLADWQQGWESMDFLLPNAQAIAMERAWLPSVFEKVRNSYDWLSSGGTTKMDELSQLSHSILTDPKNGFKKLGDRYPLYWVWCWIWSYDEEVKVYQMEQEQIDFLRQASEGKLNALPHPYDNEKIQDFVLDINTSVKDPHYRLLPYFGSDFGVTVRKALQAQTVAQMAATAIALQRYQLKNHRYPSSSTQLVPDILKKRPLDYMDGKELHYRLKPDGTFLLYSVGDNGKDDGGDPTPIVDQIPHFLIARDWVWPQPATAEEVKFYEDKEAHKRRN